MRGRLNCHVFIPDETIFDGNIEITGDLIAGNNVVVRGDISVGGDVFFGDKADTFRIEAGGDIVLGDGANISDIEAGSDIVLGERVNGYGFKALGRRLFKWKFLNTLVHCAGVFFNKK